MGVFPKAIKLLGNGLRSRSSGEIGHRLEKAKGFYVVYRTSSKVTARTFCNIVPTLQNETNLYQSMKLMEVTNQFVPVGCKVSDELVQ